MVYQCALGAEMGRRLFMIVSRQLNYTGSLLLWQIKEDRLIGSVFFYFSLNFS
jgi:hypothetical protein